MFERLRPFRQAIKRRFFRDPNPNPEPTQIGSVPLVPHALEREIVTGKRTHFLDEETQAPLEDGIVQRAIRTALALQNGDEPPSFKELRQILEIDRARDAIDSVGGQPINEEQTVLSPDGGETTSIFKADEAHIASSHMVTTVNGQGVDISRVTLRYSNPKIIFFGGEPTFCFKDHSISVHNTRAGPDEVYSDFELNVGVDDDGYSLLVTTNNFQTKEGVEIGSMEHAQIYAI